jgi:hypothetical protein
MTGGIELLVLALGRTSRFERRATTARKWNSCLPCLAKSRRISTERGSEEVGDEQTVAMGRYRGGPQCA